VSCAPCCGHAGVYIIGVQRHFSENNNVMVAKMLDEGGAEWSAPARVTSVSPCRVLVHSKQSHVQGSQRGLPLQQAAWGAEWQTAGAFRYRG
jgi:hypothetical protein